MDQTNRLTINHTAAMNTPSPDQQTPGQIAYEAFHAASPKDKDVDGHILWDKLSKGTVAGFEAAASAILTKHMPQVTAEEVQDALDINGWTPAEVAETLNAILRSRLVPEAAVVEWEEFERETTRLQRGDIWWENPLANNYGKPVTHSFGEINHVVIRRRKKQAESPTQEECTCSKLGGTGHHTDCPMCERCQRESNAEYDRYDSITPLVATASITDEAGRNLERQRNALREQVEGLKEKLTHETMMADLFEMAERGQNSVCSALREELTAAQKERDESPKILFPAQTTGDGTASGSLSVFARGWNGYRQELLKLNPHLDGRNSGPLDESHKYRGDLGALASARNAVEILGKQVAKMKERATNSEPSENCPFCAVKGATGHSQDCPMCNLCQLESDKEDKDAEIARLKEECAVRKAWMLKVAETVFQQESPTTIEPVLNEIRTLHKKAETTLRTTPAKGLTTQQVDTFFNEAFDGRHSGDERRKRFAELVNEWLSTQPVSPSSLTTEQVRQALGTDWMPVVIPYDTIRDRLNVHLVIQPLPVVVKDGFIRWLKDNHPELGSCDARAVYMREGFEAALSTKTGGAA